MLPNAFATLLTTPSYLPGVLVVLNALKALHPEPRDFKIICLVTPETVDAKTMSKVRKAGFDTVIGVEPIGSGLPGQDALTLMGRPDLNLALTKLHLFRLYEHYSTIIYLDADTLPLRPISHLFTTTFPHIISACPDTGWPDCFNSGVMVIRPRQSDWAGMQGLLKNGENDQGIYSGNGSFDGADQGLLNEWFSAEGGGGNWNRLSFTYNVTPTAAYQYAPAYRRYGHTINVVHFIGPHKPWANVQFRPSGVSVPSNNDTAYDYPALMDKWYAVYDKYVRSKSALVTDSRFAVPQTAAVWDKPSDQSQQPMNLDELRSAAEHGVAGSGQYISFPLEGRIDLMMPKPVPRVRFHPPTPSPQSSATVTPTPAPPPPPVAAPPPPPPPPAPTPQPESVWDASRHAPPAKSQPEMAISVDTFYRPAWERPPQEQFRHFHAPSQTRPEPQYPHLPPVVTTNEWYKDYSHVKPNPKSIQPVFPWESQAHRAPERVFPRGSSPPPRHRIPEDKGKGKAPPAPVNLPPPAPVTPPRPPPQTFEEAVAGYRNAWDTDSTVRGYWAQMSGNSSNRRPRRIDPSDLKSLPGTPRFEHNTNPLGKPAPPAGDTRSEASGDGDDEDSSEEDNSSGQMNSPIVPVAPRFEQVQMPSAPRYRDRHTQTERPTLSDATVQAKPGGGTSPAMRTIELPSGSNSRNSSRNQSVDMGTGGSRGGSGPPSRGEPIVSSIRPSVPHRSPEQRVGTAARPTHNRTGSRTSITSPGGNGNGDGANGPRTVRSPHSSSDNHRSSNLVTPPSDQIASGSGPVPFPSHPSVSVQPLQPIFTDSSRGSTSQGRLADSPTSMLDAYTNAGVPRQPQSGGRVWNPSTDIDMRKKETQQVLTRFMNTGSFGRG